MFTLIFSQLETEKKLVCDLVLTFAQLLFLDFHIGEMLELNSWEKGTSVTPLINPSSFRKLLAPAQVCIHVSTSATSMGTAYFIFFIIGLHD